jgi:hypothetical protein
MKYTERELFFAMEECEKGKEVKITCTDGQEIMGRCWAYSASENEAENGTAEASLDIGPGLVIYSSEIDKIEIL